ncbi:MAG: hypothetical protein KKH25_05880, partial [Candidatus Omnitrophica bacterium]|nr:hypothetical protein [Candidatus Omnitrophota bacterium]
ELIEKLSKFNLRQIHQRIFVKHNISPLSLEESERYVKFRLKQAEAGHIEISQDSFKLIYEFSKGIPRLINMLCDRALLLGFVKEYNVFGPEIFSACIKELQ